MTINTAVSRRGILAGGAAAAGAAVLAACSGGSGSGSEASGADVISPAAPTAAPTAAATATATATATAAQPDGSSTAPADTPAATSLVALDDLTVGYSKAVTLANGKPAIVTRTGTATAVCFSAICTHTGCTVKPKGARFDCPCHGSVFDARTGKVLGGPAPSPLPGVDVEVAGGLVTEA